MITRNFRREQKRKRVMAYFINATIELMEEIGIENLTIRKLQNVPNITAQLYTIILTAWMSWKCLQV